MEFNSGFLLPRWLLRLPTCIVGGSTLHNHPVDFIFHGMSQNRKQRSKWSNSRSSRGSRALKRTSPGDVAVATPMCLAFADTLCRITQNCRITLGRSSDGMSSLCGVRSQHSTFSPSKKTLRGRVTYLASIILTQNTLVRV